MSANYLNTPMVLIHGLYLKIRKFTPNLYIQDELGE